MYGPSTKVASSTVDVRTQLQKLGTDIIWNCSLSTWWSGPMWPAAALHIYMHARRLARFYPDIDEMSYCTQLGAVCHEDDIEIVLGAVY